MQDFFLWEGDMVLKSRLLFVPFDLVKEHPTPWKFGKIAPLKRLFTKKQTQKRKKLRLAFGKKSQIERARIQKSWLQKIRVCAEANIRQSEVHW